MMLFPEPAGSLASMLTLIDSAIKFWRFLSPKARQVYCAQKSGHKITDF
jgi:hypothetical protein